MHLSFDISINNFRNLLSFVTFENIRIFENNNSYLLLYSLKN